MPMNLAAIAKTVGQSDAQGSGNYLKPGFLGEIALVKQELKDLSTKKLQGTKHTHVVSEFVVTETNDPDIHKVGASVTIMENLDERNANLKQAAQRFKALIVALAEVPESTLTNEQWEKQTLKALDGTSALKGTKIRIETWSKEREEGDAITKIKYLPPVIAAN